MAYLKHTHRLIMNTFQSLKNRIQLAMITLPAVCYAQDDTEFKFGVGDDFKNLKNITPSSFIGGAIKVALTLTIIVFFFIFVLGGIKWITSSGDEKKLAVARSQITNGLIGLLIILSSWAILGLIGTIFEIKLLELTIPSFIKESIFGTQELANI